MECSGGPILAQGSTNRLEKDKATRPLVLRMTGAKLHCRSDKSEVELLDHTWADRQDFAMKRKARRWKLWVRAAPTKCGCGKLGTLTFILRNVGAPDGYKQNSNRVRFTF